MMAGQGTGRNDQAAIEAFEATQVSKIKVAVTCMLKFLRDVMGSDDRCSVAAFNEKYTPIVSMQDVLHTAIALVVCAEICSGGTHMYDACCISVAQFFVTANARRPWVLVILTDGDDMGSDNKLEAAADMLETFNKPADNFVFVIGLGREINEANLKRLCRLSKSCYLPAKDSEALEPLFELIRLSIVEGIAIDSATIEREGAKNVFDRVARLRPTVALARKSVDILMLVDVSGSMNCV
jgi:Mg-chelatase subunit ChlD